MCILFIDILKDTKEIKDILSFSPVKMQNYAHNFLQFNRYRLNKCDQLDKNLKKWNFVAQMATLL